MAPTDLFVPRGTRVLVIFVIYSQKNICTPVSEISVQCKYMLRVNIRTPLKVIFDTKNIIGGFFRMSIQYVSQLLTVSNQKLNKTVILTCRCSMCIENESTGKYTCSHAPYTRFTSVGLSALTMISVGGLWRSCGFYNEWSIDAQLCAYITRLVFH